MSEQCPLSVAVWPQKLVVMGFFSVTSCCFCVKWYERAGITDLFQKTGGGKILMLNLIQESERLVSMCITLMHANNSNNNKLNFIAFSFQRRLKERS